MNIVIRVDASEKIGSGHFYRTFLLAKYLKKKNRIHFISENLKKEYKDKLNKENFVFHKINIKKNLPNDSLQTITKLKKIGKPIDLLIVDNYKLSYFWEIQIAKYVKKIFVIDDFQRKHYCNIYLNYNTFKINKKLLPKECIKLLGPKYILLNPIYKKKVKQKKTPNKKKNIFVFMGGADKSKFTLYLIKYFQKKMYKNFIFNFVLGVNNKINKDILKFSRKITNYKFHYNLQNLKKLLNNSDFAISNGGQVIWEIVFNNIANVIFTKNKYQNNIILKYRKKINTDIFEITTTKYIKSYMNNLDSLLENYTYNSKKNHIKARL